LTHAQVYAALAYYSDHQEEINTHIERNRVSNERVGMMTSGAELAGRGKEESDAKAGDT
jgi:hypothetical protein